MPNWKKVIVSGSNASINKLNVATSVTASSYTGSFVGDGSQLTGIQASVSEVTGSLVVSGSNTTIGTSTVSGSFVTTGSFTVTAKGIGTAWSAGANLTSRWGDVAAVGTQTSGLAWGGYKQPYSGHQLYKIAGDTEEYDGTNWSIGGTRPYEVYYTKGFGTQGAAVSFGGKSYSTGYETNAVHKYDGTSWSAGNAFPQPRAGGGGAGVETAGLIAGGRHAYAYAYFTTNTYEYNGTFWSAGGTLPELGFDNVSIAGTQTDAILLGNSSASNAAGSSRQSAATYDGTSWTTVASTDSDKGNVVGSKADYALAVNSGLGNSTYIWTGTNWAITANSLATRTTPAMGDGNGGADSSGFIVGGVGQTFLTSTEEFNNSLSVINSLNVTKELNQNVSATGSFHGKYTGDGSTLVLDSNVVFDDEESTFTKKIHFQDSLTHSTFLLTGSNQTDLRIGLSDLTLSNDMSNGFVGVRINTGSFGHYLDNNDVYRNGGDYHVQSPNFVVSSDEDVNGNQKYPGILWPFASSSIFHSQDQRIGDKFYQSIHFDFGGISAITASANIVIEPSGSLIVAPKNGGILAVSGSIIPGTNEAYDLGSSTHRWRDLYLSGSTIDLGGTKISRDNTGDIEFKVDGNRKSLKVDELHIGSGAGARKLKVSDGRLKFTTISNTKDLDSTTDITASAVQADGATLGDFTVDGDLTVNGSIIGDSAFASLALTGTPSAPTPTSNDNSTKIATTAYVQQELTDLIGTAPSTLDTFGELSASMAADETALSSLTTTVGTKLAKTSNLSDLSDVSTARTNLGLAIGTNVQAFDADLTTLGGLAKTDGNFIVGDGTTWLAESGATARTSIGLGTSNHAQFHCLGIGTAASMVNGEIRAAGDITAYYSSDERLKENFQTLDGALDKINQINGYEFDWKEGIDDVVSKEGHDIGVKAQELQAVYPELVHERDNGYLAVDYVKLTAVLLQAVKELSTKVDKLENK